MQFGAVAAVLPVLAPSAMPKTRKRARAVKARARASASLAHWPGDGDSHDADPDHNDAQEAEPGLQAEPWIWVEDHLR
jgi:hypothetical protein